MLLQGSISSFNATIVTLIMFGNFKRNLTRVCRVKSNEHDLIPYYIISSGSGESEFNMLFACGLC